MKTINLAEQKIDVTDILAFAQSEPILLLASDGREYILAEADDFDRETAQLRDSTAFQQFLDERTAQGKRRSALDDFAREIEAELANQHESE